MGRLFENMVIAESLKAQLNAGRSGNLYFYRNATGTVEVDLLLEDGASLYPREIKSSSTYVADMRRHLVSFCDLVPQAKDPLVVYSGATFPSVAANYADTNIWASPSTRSTPLHG